MSAYHSCGMLVVADTVESTILLQFGNPAPRLAISPRGDAARLRSDARRQRVLGSTLMRQSAMKTLCKGGGLHLFRQLQLDCELQKDLHGLCILKLCADWVVDDTNLSLATKLIAAKQCLPHVTSSCMSCTNFVCRLVRCRFLTVNAGPKV